MNLPLLKPELFTTTAAGPVLVGGECVCGYVFFPLQRYGCERCGKFDAALRSRSLRGRGLLLTASVVHMHADKRRPVPFAVGTIALDDGPVVRALLADAGIAQELLQRVKATFVAVTQEDGSQAFDLRFKREVE